MAWIEPIYDRTQADVDLIKLDPTNSNTKGAYNFNDLNRIENDTEYVMDLINKSEIIKNPISLTIKTDWSVKDIPTITEFNRIRNNIITLLNVLNGEIEYEEIVLSNTMDYVKANILEDDLQIMKKYIETFGKMYRYCGDFYTGGNNLYIRERS